MHWKGSMWVTMPNFIKISQTIAEIWRFNGFFFQNGGRPPSWICLAHIRTTHDNYSVVSIVVQNLVDIDEVVLIVWNFQYICTFGLKMPIHDQKIGVCGGFHLQNGEQHQRNTQKAHPCASPRRLSHQAWKSVDGSDLWVPEKRYK